MAVYDRGGNLRTQRSLQDLFAAGLGDARYNTGDDPRNRIFDPHVVFDVGAGRFYIAAANRADEILLASLTADGRGMRLGRINTQPGADNSVDYPLLGSDGRFIYVTADVYGDDPDDAGPAESPGFVDNRVIVVEKGAFNNGGNVVRRALFRGLQDANGPGAPLAMSIVPAHDMQPGSHSDGMLVSAPSGGADFLTLFRVDSTGRTINGSRVSLGARFDPPSTSPQPGTTTRLSALNGSRVINSMRNSSGVYLAHGSSCRRFPDRPTDVMTNCALWYRINPATSRVVRSNRLAAAPPRNETDPTTDFIYPAVAASPTGRVLLTYAEVRRDRAATVFASGFDAAGASTGRRYSLVLVPTFTDRRPIQNEDPPVARFGDYAGLRPDPLDQERMFGTHQFFNRPDRWGTTIFGNLRPLGS